MDHPTRAAVGALGTQRGTRCTVRCLKWGPQRVPCSPRLCRQRDKRVPAMWQPSPGPLRWENDSQGLRCGCVSY